MSKRSTIFGCLSPFRSEISLNAVEGIPSLSIYNIIFLYATIRYNLLSCALYTIPYVPLPIFSLF